MPHTLRESLDGTKKPIMRESELLSHIYRRSADLAGQGAIIVGPGDDCAVLAAGLGAGSSDAAPAILVTVDQLVEGRHFERGTPIDLIARKAVARSVSDIAAMGGTPRAGFAAGCLPMGYAHGDELFDRMAHWARHFGCPLAGGDIAGFAPGSDGGLVLSTTVLGLAHERRGAVLRSGARVGDGVYVTGRLGGSFASGRHLTFEPRVAEGRWLCEVLGKTLGAMIDLSDGLGRDAARVGEMSGVRIEIDEARLPIHQGAGGWRAAVGDGEDYELLFTACAGAEVPGACPLTGTPITRIGAVVRGAGCGLNLSAGGAIEIGELGWDHEA
jgi:thiamine-monophosphate kinase